MTRDQLLGRLDPDTRQWQDGVLTSTAVVVNNEPKSKIIVYIVYCNRDKKNNNFHDRHHVLDNLRR